MANKTLGSLLILAATACVACTQPADEMASPEATTTMGISATGATAGASSSSTTTGIDETGTPQDSGSTDGSSSDAAIGSSEGGGTTTGVGGEAETGEMSSGGGEPPATAEFWDCPSFDMATCAAASQCLWQESGDDVPGAGACVPDPTHCETMNQAQCGAMEGCGWGPVGESDKGIEEGCTADCAGLAEENCEAWSGCTWSPPDERAAGACG